ncbi:MAG: diguanylate cyclase [Rhodocyclaceae bacterium]|nr:diguanylate cyclase [Rhodocyclaceae bacterium]
MPLILLVDDAPSSLDILVMALRDEYRVLVATNGRTALDIVRRTPHPDLVLLDVMMPEMDGFEVCRQIKSDREIADIPVIFVTANDSETDETHGLSLGALDYVTKPFSLPVVKARIRNHVQLRQQGLRLRQEIYEHQLAREGLEVAYLVYSSTSEAMMVTDANDRIVAINNAFTELTGYGPQDVIGGNPRLLNSGRHDPEFFRSMWESIQTTGAWQGEIWNRRKNGELYAQWVRINTVFNADGSVRQRVALLSDITRRKLAEEEIWRQANFDALTGLPNRRRFHDRLEHEILRAKRDGLPLALLFIDLDRFKEINDTLGHDVGDQLLVEAAHRLAGCVRESDTAARLGGDEFTAILMDIAGREGVERVAGCINRRMADPFLVGQHSVTISASIGIVLHPEMAISMDALIKAADHAMYEAKQQGRNRYCFADEARTGS